MHQTRADWQTMTLNAGHAVCLFVVHPVCFWVDDWGKAQEPKSHCWVLKCTQPGLMLALQSFLDNRRSANTTLEIPSVPHQEKIRERKRRVKEKWQESDAQWQADEGRESQNQRLMNHRQTSCSWFLCYFVSLGAVVNNSATYSVNFIVNWNCPQALLSSYQRSKNYLDLLLTLR